MFWWIALGVVVLAGAALLWPRGSRPRTRFDETRARAARAKDDGRGNTFGAGEGPGF